MGIRVVGGGDMDIIELVVWLLLLVGTVVAWVVVAFFAWMVGWSLAEGRSLASRSVPTGCGTPYGSGYSSPCLA